MRKKVLLLGGGHAEIPLIQALQARNYEVITTGNNDGGLGHRYSDKYICEYFSNKEKILALAKKENIDGIVSGCNDFALLTAVWVSEKLNLKGHDSYETSLHIHIKDKYRTMAQELFIKTPRAVRCSKPNDCKKILECLNFPLIIKPVDLTGGKGVKRCNTERELGPALEAAIKATRENYIIAEEFIEGTNHGFSAFIQNQKVVFYFADDEQYYINKYLVSGASTNKHISENTIQKLLEDLEKIATKLNLVDGILHTQFILDSNSNEPTIIEITRRSPGDLYIKFVELATGINYADLIVAAELGLPLEKIQQKNIMHNIVRHCIMGNKTGVLKNVKIDRCIHNTIKESLEWWRPGDIIENEKLYKAGIVFIYFDSDVKMQQTLPYLNDLISLEVENFDEKNV